MDNKKLLQLLFYISKHSVEHKRLLSSKDIITLLVLQECLSSSSFATIMNKSKDNSWDTPRDLMVIAKGIFQMSLNVTISEHFEEMNQRECTAKTCIVSTQSLEVIMGCFYQLTILLRIK